MYWVFNEAQIDQALAEVEARRQQEGASEQQARDETTLIKLFLVSAEVQRNKLIWRNG